MKATKKIETPRQWRGLKYHQFSELTDFGAGIDIESLAAHMQKHGYDATEPIVLYDGRILDGRHKHDAAQKAEVEPVFLEFTGDDEAALEFVRKKLLRQHLDSSQRAMVAAKLADLHQGGDRRSGDFKASKEVLKIAEAAAQMNVSESAVDRARVVQEKCSAAVQRAVRTGTISVTDAAAIAGHRKPDQDRALQLVRDGKAKTLTQAAGPKKPAKKKPKPPPVDDSGIPKDVQARIADTWHMDAAQRVDKLLTEAKSVALWSVWLDSDVLTNLVNVKEALLAAVPRMVCPDCNGQKVIDKAPCQTCRQSGYLAAQVA